MRLSWLKVAAVLNEDDATQSLRLDDADGTPQQYPAVAYTSLVGRCSAGEEVLVNTTAADMALGTGSVHFVVARADAGLSDDSSGGHVMKLRYTPLQRDVLAVEEPASPHHEAMRSAETLGGVPVVCCGLHSQLVHAAVAIKDIRPEARLAYVMTDQAALPLQFSRLARECRAVGLFDVVITSGQAFGGELEAVNLHSALLAARHASHADAVLVSLGPGIVGTATPFGHGGVSQGEAINAVAALGGLPVAALRLSFADRRPRHTPVSHHTLTALTRVALAPARVAVPALDPEQAGAVRSALLEAGVWDMHERAEATISPSSLPSTRGVDVTTMGRRIADDPAFFAAAAAAGEIAAGLLAR